MIKLLFIAVVMVAATYAAIWTYRKARSLTPRGRARRKLADAREIKDEAIEQKRRLSIDHPYQRRLDEVIEIASRDERAAIARLEDLGVSEVERKAIGE